MIPIKLPAQKKRFKAKTKTWREDCVNTIDSGISYNVNEEVRVSIKEKYINSRLFDGILDMEDVAATISSAGTLNAYVPKKIQNRPLLRSKIELLAGEATKEPFDWAVMVTDPTSISKKEEEKKKSVDKKIMELLQAELSDEELKKAMQELELYFKYTWKDVKEVRATKVLKHYWNKLKLEELFNSCMFDRLIFGEELIMFDIIGNEVAVYKLDPKRVFTLYASYSPKISDADIIIIEEYWSPGKIIDNYYDYLKPSDIDRINEGQLGGADDRDSASTYHMSSDGLLVEGMIETMGDLSTEFVTTRAAVDHYGNYRVLRVLWRSQKLVYIVKGIDPETGESYEKTMSEEYIPDPIKNETLTKYWVEEWWQGGKVGVDIYLPIKPRPVQFREQGNISKGHPGIVGRVNSVAEGKVVSFLSKMKPYQYLYNITWDRLLDALKKDLGNIVEMDLAKKPAGWEVSKWLNYAYKGGIMFVDSFKEATKGAATGKLAGVFNTTGKTISSSNGNYIQQHVNLLEFIKSELADIVGITPQREGMVQASAAVGTTERSVMQSNNNTAYEFYQHQQFKLEALQILLETSKVALKHNNLIAQNILNDFSIEMFEVDGDEFLDSDYSVFLTVSTKSKDMQRNLEMYSQAFMQNGGNFSTVLDILFSDSITEKRRKIELAESKMQEERQAQQEQAAQMQQEQIASDAEDKQKDRELEIYKTDSDNATKILIEEMKQSSEDTKVNSDNELSSKEILFKITELNEKMKMERQKDDTKKEVEKTKAKAKKQ